ncbi:unnamed protein product [Caenorhabditis brenneri]
MDSESLDHNLFSRLSIEQVLDQRFSEEFRVRVPPPSPPPPPLLVPHQYGSIGDQPRQRAREGEMADQAPAEISPREGHRHHHRDEPMAPPARAPPPPAPLIVPIWLPVFIPLRPLCCSFCFGTATQRAGEFGERLPERDDWGAWSTHSCKERGIVTCPFLWQVTCPICGATGATAHTRAEHVRMEQRGGG